MSILLILLGAAVGMQWGWPGIAVWIGIYLIDLCLFKRILDSVSGVNELANGWRVRWGRKPFGAIAVTVVEWSRKT